MEDKFKLKVYIEKYKKVLDVKGLWFNDPNLLTDVVNIIDPNDKFKNHIKIPIQECKLLQCTGLKDKNGNLIYEGDILEYQNEEAKNGQYEVEKYNPLKNNNLTLDEEWQDEVDEYRFNNVEIIGNIYENPELLKEQK